MPIRLRVIRLIFLRNHKSVELPNRLIITNNNIFYLKFILYIVKLTNFNSPFFKRRSTIMVLKCTKMKLQSNRRVWDLNRSRGMC